MKKNYGKVNNLSNIIPFSKYSKKDSQNVTSTIAAIIAIKIDHPSDISPEDYFINQLESYDNIDILAFEDALENEHIGISSIEAQNEAINDA
jgi:hypothetical protein|tara:strand:+ start:233 stop:508 length:276 start_codon:yes stop_codon:yes gene_type:complete